MVIMFIYLFIYFISDPTCSFHFRKPQLYRFLALGAKPGSERACVNKSWDSIVQQAWESITLIFSSAAHRGRSMMAVINLTTDHAVAGIEEEGPKRDCFFYLRFKNTSIWLEGKTSFLTDINNSHIPSNQTKDTHCVNKVNDLRHISENSTRMPLMT